MICVKVEKKIPDDAITDNQSSKEALKNIDNKILKVNDKNGKQKALSQNLRANLTRRKGIQSKSG